MTTASVVVATFRRADYLREALQSVLSQSYKDLELLVVDDNGPDSPFSAHVHDIIASLHDSRVRYLGGDKNRGCPGARNVGLAAARGDFVAFTDDDDVWKPRKLEKQIAQLQGQQRCTFVGCGWRRFDDRGPISEHYPTYSGNVYGKLAINHIGPPSCVLFRTEDARSLGGFDEHYRLREDIEFYTRVARLGEFAFVPEVLLEYRIHAGNISAKTKEKLYYVDAYREKHALYLEEFKEAHAQLLERRADLLLSLGSKGIRKAYGLALMRSFSKRRLAKAALSMLTPRALAHLKRSTF